MALKDIELPRGIGRRIMRTIWPELLSIAQKLWRSSRDSSDGGRSITREEYEAIVDDLRDIVQLLMGLLGVVIDEQQDAAERSAARNDGLVSTSEPPAWSMSNSKAELIAAADESGVTLKSTWTKSQILDALTAAG